MATWTDIASTDVDQDSPVTSSLMIALRDNPQAIAEGASGAPRLINSSIPEDEIDSEGHTLTVSAADTYTIEDGAGLVHTVGDHSVQSSPSYVVAETIDINGYSGSIRFKASHASSEGTSYLSIYKNSSLVNTWSTTTGYYVSRTQDISVSVGDVIEWKHRYTSYFSNSSETASNAYYRLGVLMERA